ncbi:MAG: DUF393 domain-containing protein [Bacteroidetes bacterium]|nr:MAG: DUF393 domain-containing protein [Bacteroidota bacterium]
MNQGIEHSIILIDDECVMCNKLVRFIATADSDDRFRITGLNSRPGKILLNKFQLEKPGPERLILIEQQFVYEASEAVCRILIQLKNYSRLGKFLRFIPAKFRDQFYYLIARNRYRLFGKSKLCSLDEKLVKKMLR